MKEKGDLCILVGYSTQSKGYRVYNKRTRMIVESIHIRFDEIKEVSETCVANDTSCLVSKQHKALDYDNSDPVPQRQDVFSSANAHVPSQQELDLLFDPLYDEFFNAEVAESSSHNIGNLNVLTFNQPQVFEYRWTKDHPREQEAIANSAWIEAMQEELHQFERLQEAIADSAWIEAMQEELHQFERLQEEVYVAQPDGFVDPDHPEKAKYALEILHKHGMDKGQSIGTPMATKPILDADLSGNPVDQTDYRSKIGFDLTTFSNADHAGYIDTRKSTSRGIQFLGDKLVSWMSKKQNCTAMSSAEAEYVALSASYAQVMWIRTQLPLAFPEDRFKYLVRQIGMRCLTPAELE
nr:hypothetical protein [Tanacetum cinerariifolium]GFA01965.1 hypothetical protein [Tanacetum cinerariifolium]